MVQVELLCRLSDFKNEVKEAIPYNAALMSKAGVVTAINSDNRDGKKIKSRGWKNY